MTSEKSSDEKPKKVEKESVNNNLQGHYYFKSYSASDREKPGLKAKKTEKSVKLANYPQLGKKNKGKKGLLRLEET